MMYRWYHVVYDSAPSFFFCATHKQNGTLLGNERQSNKDDEKKKMKKILIEKNTYHFAFPALPLQRLQQG